ncbi:hypothetical protein EB796_000712 [Bugula neritina]|uniref:Uncharacterized protein n=1 Tax=Bugula neritina TaxID=10212 RepID=A0A7J7KSB7_BUGNE|nr:hypothetical protein EB796_000712 [Bugula neritina]
MLSLQSSLVTLNAINLQYQREIPCQNESSPPVSCYVDVVRDLKDKTCIIACLNGKLVLLSVEELENMCMKLTVVLRSGPV